MSDDSKTPVRTGRIFAPSWVPGNQSYRAQWTPTWFVMHCAPSTITYSAVTEDWNTLVSSMTERPRDQ